ncbi:MULTISPECIES: hypothetical protein [Lacticaseibacillus]|uniref:Hypothetical phage protein n=1 Tax=Lacticaseibacillus casei DSM 20011 = JCM 1134 = ATCC 393 TaxID=1423732 RepID=A0AAD1APN5_LACCA|nr:hypothetical protein [Lacticaseibacillus casei]MBI6598850.1 phage infection protein [Lacticaseibacillus casei]MBO1482521.1 phage infection protein [Lacticaseibacillus casei]MBO2417802.1 phage infection protein [Lacticaseibacillus casei]MCK2082176.1 phage infection protein [Lacticaseibacillus casei]MED7631880.1 phage infection protein [Lacticaseibacillus casei]
METKEKMRVLFTLDSDGYIIGYQREFFDGKEWQTPFDTTNAVEVAPGDLDTIVMGATKLRNGKLVVDEAKQAELEQPVTPQPTTDQQMLAAVMLRVAKLEAGA